MERAGVTSRKVATSRSVMRCEDRIANECRIANQLGDAVGRVTRRRDDAHVQLTQWKTIARLRERIELTSVRWEIDFEFKPGLEGLLNLADPHAMPTREPGSLAFSHCAEVR